MKRTTAATIIITASLLALGTAGALIGVHEKHFRSFLADTADWTDATLRGELPAAWQDDRDVAGPLTSETEPADTGKPAAESITEAATESSPIMNESVQPVTEPEPEAFQFSEEGHRIIFVGDSRTVGMGDAEAKTEDDCIYIGEVGEGINWFNATGRARMEEAIRKNPDAPVVLNLGVNDLSLGDSSCSSQYIALYQSFATAYPDTRFWIMSVNPVTEDCANVTNNEITALNNALRAAFPDQFIDTFTFMKKKGFETPDGIHYTNETYMDIHDYVVEELVSISKKENK